MSDWRARYERSLIDAENERARRLVVLADALDAVLALDAFELDDVRHREPLQAAARAVADLRRTW